MPKDVTGVPPHHGKSFDVTKAPDPDQTAKTLPNPLAGKTVTRKAATSSAAMIDSIKGEVKTFKQTGISPISAPILKKLSHKEQSGEFSQDLTALINNIVNGNIDLKKGDLNFRIVNLSKTASPSSTEFEDKTVKKGEKLEALIKPLTKEAVVDMADADGFLVNYKGRDVLLAPEEEEEDDSPKMKNLKEFAEREKYELVPVKKDQWKQFVIEIGLNPGKFIKEKEDKKPEHVQLSEKTAIAAVISQRKEATSKESEKQEIAEKLAPKETNVKNANTVAAKREKEQLEKREKHQSIIEGILEIGEIEEKENKQEDLNKDVKKD